MRDGALGSNHLVAAPGLTPSLRSTGPTSGRRRLVVARKSCEPSLPLEGETIARSLSRQGPHDFGTSGGATLSSAGKRPTPPPASACR